MKTNRCEILGCGKMHPASETQMYQLAEHTFLKCCPDCWLDMEVGDNQQLFYHLLEQHKLTLLESELEEIIRIAKKILDKRHANH